MALSTATATSFRVAMASFQVTGADDYYGYGIDTTAPDRAEAEHAIQTIQSLFPAA